MKTLLTFATVLFSAGALFANSYYADRLDDAKAIYLTRDAFTVHGDGVADDWDVLQQAINKVQQATNQGILFLPSGRYHVTKTIYIWPGIRVIGYGKTRPVLVLGRDTPGFQEGPTYMIFFAGGLPGTGRSRREAKPRAKKTPPDASPGTFFSPMSNVDIEIHDGNTPAVACLADYAQHCFLAHMNFHIGSGLAGI